MRHSFILPARSGLGFTNENLVASRKEAKHASKTLCVSASWPAWIAGQGREQAVPAHPALSAFVHPCTADAEALPES